ncbi:MAG: hypothetical protein FJ038_14080 [Chloroflexi bacterium]|nr:hypothetical protein [Chloroflexota bacterium]
MVFDRSGTFLRTFGEGLFTTAHGIHIAPDDTVWTADSSGSTVRKFSPSGELLMTIGTQGVHSDTGINEAGDFRTITHGGAPFHWCTNVAVSPSGEFYVSDGYGNARVHHFAEDGSLIRSWGEPGAGPGQFRVPHSVFIDKRGLLYVTDRENNRVQVFTGDGTHVAEWDDVRRPNDIFITDDDLVFVAEMGMSTGMMPGLPVPTSESPPSRVTVRDINGRVLSAWGGDHSGDTDPCAPGNFFAAHGIWVDRHGSIYVGEVILGAGASGGYGAGLARLPVPCRPFQVFHPV